MQAFASGPFSFDPAARGVTINGQARRRWTLSYGDGALAERTLDELLPQDGVREAFAPDISAFIQSRQPVVAKEIAPRREMVQLVTSTDRTGVIGDVLGAFEQRAEVQGLTAGLIDDRYETWLVTGRPMRALPLSLHEFHRLKTAHEAIAAAEDAPRPTFTDEPMHAWIADMLPGVVLTSEPGEWRPPTSWEIRHVVGEGSFTGISGARAAALVGISPQNFRKYTARDDAVTRQSISFAAWHLLLHKLGVQRA